MVAVLDVITNLEKFPITKEALEETRLGKLINDLRKKTKDEDLAKRAKKLLRNWQKLIEPGQNDTPTRSAPGTPGSANGAAHPYRTDIMPTTLPAASKICPEGLKNRTDIHNTYSPKAEKSSSRKRKEDYKDSFQPPAKMSKLSVFEKTSSCSPLSTNGVGGSPDTLSEREMPQPSDRHRSEHLENDRQNKIPVNAVRPHSNSPGLTKLPSTSVLIKTAVQQQYARMEGNSAAQQHQPKSPYFSSHSPQSSTQEMLPAKRSSTYAPKECLSSPLHTTSQVPSPLSLSRSSLSPARECNATEENSPGRHKPSLHLHSSSEPSHPPSQHGTISRDPNADTLCASRLHKMETPDLLRQGLNMEAGSGESEGLTSGFEGEGKKMKKYRSKDYVVNLQGQPFEDKTRPVRLKERRLTFDPVTGQIKPLTPKESHLEESTAPPPSIMEPTKQNPPAPLPSPFQQTNWKELSRNEIIQSYLNIQSNVLNSSGAQTHGAHFFMTEYLKREKPDTGEPQQTHVLMPSSSTKLLPGISRELSEEDLHKVQTSHWPGVNGCYDTKGMWYDWTECITLDPHGDDGKLNILPYVCLD